MINVLLVDDHELVRVGVRRLLSDTRDIIVYAEADSGEAAIEAVRNCMPDVILMDVSMPGMGGLEATRRLVKVYPDIKVIALTVHANDPFPSQLLKAGAMGYLTKGCSLDEVVGAIRQAVMGKSYISPDIAQSLALSLLPGNDSPIGRLSRRELQVMMMLVQGNKLANISEQLCLSPKTVSTYRYRLYDKLSVRTDAELTRLAIHYGMLDDMS
ncbi:MAG: UvrY/SirA/GacA family response regulator transcription factor [Thiohalomonadaceae bacterium]